MIYEKTWALPAYTVSIEKSYITAGDRMAVTRQTVSSTTTFTYYGTDHLGSVRATAVFDSAGHCQASTLHDFEPYGLELPVKDTTSLNTHKYTGQERDDLAFDPTTGTHFAQDYMHFRAFGTAFGRFMRPDTIPGNPANPQSWNLYGYVGGNPTGFLDPSGHFGTPPQKQMGFFAYAMGGGFFSSTIGILIQFGAADSYAAEGNYAAIISSGSGTYNSAKDSWTFTVSGVAGAGGYLVGFRVGVQQWGSTTWTWGPIEWGWVQNTSWTMSPSVWGALRELGGVFAGESLNFRNRWPFWGGTKLWTGRSCYEYADALKQRINQRGLTYWTAVVYLRQYSIPSLQGLWEGGIIDAHYSVVLAPTTENPLPPVWIDFYTNPTVSFGAYPSDTMYGPVRLLFQPD